MANGTKVAPIAGAAAPQHAHSAFPKLPAPLLDVGCKHHLVSGCCHFTKCAMSNIPKIDQLHLASFAQTQSNLVHPIGSQAANDKTGLVRSIVGHSVAVSFQIGKKPPTRRRVEMNKRTSC